jgi:P-type E1-E2 ATPase
VTFVYLYFSFSFATTSINYILLYVSYLKIKTMAEQHFDVHVIREGREVVIQSNELFPGDVVIPHKDDEVSFDGVLMQGEVYVNEASLTGESIPVGKFTALNLTESKQENTWLFEGSKVL